MKMRSLTLKLTLTFLLVGVMGVLIFAALMWPSTRTGFANFLSAHDQAVLVSTLSDYYTTHSSWDGVTDTLSSTSVLSTYNHGAILVDASQNIVIGPPTTRGQRKLPLGALSNSTLITVNGQLVGYVLFTPLNPQPRSGSIRAPGAGPGPSPETVFLDQMTSAAATSAAATVLIALVVGVILARTLTRPIAELTAATKAMAGGKLGQQVRVRSRDEIGTLATSFNQMSADIARATRLRKQMTADLAHDLRTPLSILRGYTEGLSEERLRGTPAVYAVMHDEVEHLQRLVDDLRTLSLVDAGELPLNRRAVDPKALLERTGLAYYVQIEQHGLALRVEAPDSLPSISVDTDRMTQVLNNLVTNALRHTTQGEIVLSAKQVDQRICLQVTDSGAGIEPEHLPFIFDRFYRVDPARQRSDNSMDDTSGLGLAIAKAIVEALGGAISVESTVGKSTTFSLNFPILPAREIHAGQPVPAGG
jgi:two-component system, OmpR family, sensor histidine kinase BaeS